VITIFRTKILTVITIFRTEILTVITIFRTVYLEYCVYAIIIM